MGCWEIGFHVSYVWMLSAFALHGCSISLWAPKLAIEKHVKSFHLPFQHDWNMKTEPEECKTEAEATCIPLLCLKLPLSNIWQGWISNIKQKKTTFFFTDTEQHPPVLWRALGSQHSLWRGTCLWSEWGCWEQIWNRQACTQSTCRSPRTPSSQRGRPWRWAQGWAQKRLCWFGQSDWKDNDDEEKINTGTNLENIWLLTQKADI